MKLNVNWKLQTHRASQNEFTRSMLLSSLSSLSPSQYVAAAVRKHIQITVTAFTYTPIMHTQHTTHVHLYSADADTVTQVPPKAQRRVNKMLMFVWHMKNGWYTAHTHLATLPTTHISLHLIAAAHRMVSFHFDLSRRSVGCIPRVRKPQRIQPHASDRTDSIDTIQRKDMHRQTHT